MMITNDKADKEFPASVDCAMQSISLVTHSAFIKRGQICHCDYRTVHSVAICKEDERSRARYRMHGAALPIV